MVTFSTLSTSQIAKFGPLRRNLPLSVLVAWAFCIGAHSASASLLPGKCEGALVPAITSGSHTESEQYLLLYTVDEQTFNQIKQNLGTGGRVAIAGIPIESSTTWADFRQKAESVLKSVRVEASKEVATSWYESKLTMENVTAYTACLKTDTVGLTAYLKDVVGDIITVEAVFHTARDDHKKRKVTLHVDGDRGKLLSEADQVFENGSQHAWTVQRHKPGPIPLRLSVLTEQEKFSSDSTMPAVVTDKPVVKRLKELEERDAETLYMVNPANPRGEPLDYEPGALVNFHNGPQQSTLYYAAPPGCTILTHGLIWRFSIRAKMDSGLNPSSDSKQVAYNLSANGDGEGRGAGIAQIKAIISCPTQVQTWVEVP